MLPRIGDVPLVDLSPRKAKELVTKMWDDGLSAKTICNYFFVFASVIASAKDDEGQELFPHKWDRKFLDLPKVDKASQKRPTYTAADVENIITKAGAGEDVIYALLAGTGLRVGEALGLKVHHFNGDSLKIDQALWNGELYSPKTTRHLRAINRQTVENQLRQAERAAQFADDATRPLHEKNVEILRRRLQTFDDIERSVKRVEAQLQMIENFFGLVNDQDVTMPTPEHILTLDFDSLLSSIEMTKEILQQTAPIMGSLESLSRDANQLRPSLATERR